MHRDNFTFFAFDMHRSPLTLVCLCVVKIWEETIQCTTLLHYMIREAVVGRDLPVICAHCVSSHLSHSATVIVQLQQHGRAKLTGPLAVSVLHKKFEISLEKLY
jgi:hypothetical protein